MPSASPQHTLDRAVERLAIPDGARLLVGVSGGPDSMALLHTAAGLAETHHWNLMVGHVHHGLRGIEADDDERLVRAVGGRLDLPVGVAHVDTADHARREKLSIEAAARDLRYRALYDLLDRWPGDFILAGHTLDDQAETFLLRLLRGAGPRGLGAMRVRSDRILRPFLEVPREIVRRAVDEQTIPHSIDSSNADRHHRRNALRLDLMPALTQFEPKAARLIARAASLLQTDADYLRSEGERALESLSVIAGSRRTVLRAPWLALYPAIRRETLRLLIGHLSSGMPALDARHLLNIERAIMRSTSIEHGLPGGLVLLVGQRSFVLQIGLPNDQLIPPSTTLHVPGEAAYGQFSFSAEMLEAGSDVERLLAVAGPWHALLDADRLGSRVIIRARLAGDRVHPVGLAGTRTLQDVMVDRKIPRVIRASLPVLEVEGRVVWVPGVILDRRFTAQAGTGRIVHLSVKPPENLHGTI